MESKASGEGEASTKTARPSDGQKKRSAFIFKLTVWTCSKVLRPFFEEFEFKNGFRRVERLILEFSKQFWALFFYRPP